MSELLCIEAVGGFFFSFGFAGAPGTAFGRSNTDASNRKTVDPAVFLEKPTDIPEHLCELFDSMKTSNRRSRDVFRKLSTAQMNFKSSKGSHTLRWNAEHMAGYQLLFFLQIYQETDPEIPLVN
ncbi:MAG: hypothetical protein VXZ82_08095 [Planctomycetota bacterium]|nr:hypothetical protein [Planctomycetota bacterium]